MRDRDLVRLYWPLELRPAFDALFALDDAFAEIVATATQPALGAIRLAWWREALERLDVSPPPPEPRLTAAASLLLTRGVSGALLAEIADGWARLFDEEGNTQARGERGAALFAAGARLLGSDDPQLAEAGRLYALADNGRRGLAVMGERAAERLRFKRPLRPLTALARLGTRDLSRGGGAIEPEATPGRAWALLTHRWTGVVA